MRRYHQNYFSSIFVFKDAKSCHVFLFIYANIIFYFLFLRDLDICEFQIKLYFLKEDVFCCFRRKKLIYLILIKHLVGRSQF
jgi:hypothetical protein